jgi:hypothetical protein
VGQDNAEFVLQPDQAVVPVHRRAASATTTMAIGRRAARR